MLIHLVQFSRNLVPKFPNRTSGHVNLIVMCFRVDEIDFKIGHISASQMTANDGSLVDHSVHEGQLQTRVAHQSYQIGQLEPVVHLILFQTASAYCDQTEKSNQFQMGLQFAVRQGIYFGVHRSRDHFVQQLLIHGDGKHVVYCDPVQWIKLKYWEPICDTKL